MNLSGYKTYFAGAAAILGALAAYASGELTLGELVTAAFLAAQTMFLRSGVSAEVAKIKGA